MSFNETRLNDKNAYGFEGGPSFSTRVVRRKNAAESRNRNWVAALWKYRAPYSSLTPEAYATIYACFLSSGGMADGFRFKDWMDFQGVGQALGTATGSSQVLQVKKSYAFGSGGYERLIKKLVAGTLQLYGNGVAFAYTSVDVNTGLVTFTRTAGHAITADFEFDVPVRFDTDYLPASYVNFRRLQLEVPLEELRNP